MTFKRLTLTYINTNSAVTIVNLKLITENKGARNKKHAFELMHKDFNDEENLRIGVKSSISIAWNMCNGRDGNTIRTFGIS